MLSTWALWEYHARRGLVHVLLVASFGFSPAPMAQRRLRWPLRMHLTFVGIPECKKSKMYTYILYRYMYVCLYIHTFPNLATTIYTHIYIYICNIMTEGPGSHLCSVERETPRPVDGVAAPVILRLPVDAGPSVPLQRAAELPRSMLGRRLRTIREDKGSIS